MAPLCYWDMVFCYKESIRTMDFIYSSSLCPKVDMFLTRSTIKS